MALGMSIDTKNLKTILELFFKVIGWFRYVIFVFVFYFLVAEFGNVTEGDVLIKRSALAASYFANPDVGHVYAFDERFTSEELRGHFDVRCRFVADSGVGSLQSSEIDKTLDFLRSVHTPAIDRKYVIENRLSALIRLLDFPAWFFDSEILFKGIRTNLEVYETIYSFNKHAYPRLSDDCVATIENDVSFHVGYVYCRIEDIIIARIPELSDGRVLVGVKFSEEPIFPNTISKELFKYQSCPAARASTLQSIRQRLVRINQLPGRSNPPATVDRL